MSVGPGKCNPGLRAPVGVEGSHGTRCKPGARGLLRAEARPHKPSFLGGRMGSTVASAHVSPGGTMQGLPHVTSMDSLLIPRSGDSTGGDARPACLRLWEHCSPSERGPLLAAPQPAVPPCPSTPVPSPRTPTRPRRLPSHALSKVIQNLFRGQSHCSSLSQFPSPEGEGLSLCRAGLSSIL